MKGLLRKDLYMMKNTFGTLVAFMLVYAVIGYYGANASMLSAILAIIIMMLPANSISYDEFYHWDRYVLTMPVSRRMVVQSKYVLCLLLVLFAMLVGILFSLLLGESWENALLSNGFVALLALLMTVLSLPAMLKWGAQKGRLIMVLLCGVAGGLIAIVSISISYGGMTLGPLDGEGVHASLLTGGMLLAALCIFTAVAMAVSYRISCRLYEKKGF